MPREMLPDGTYREVTWDEIREEDGEEAVRMLQAPRTPRSEMREGQRVLADRMQAEAEYSALAYENGHTIDDAIPGFSLKRPEAAAGGGAPAEAPGAESDASGPTGGETGEDGR